MDEDIMVTPGECCANCANKYAVEIILYQQYGGCEHETPPQGFICAAFADEGLMDYMIGLDPLRGMCECYCERKEKK